MIIEEKILLEQIEQRKDELFSLLSDMIRIESQSDGETATGHEENMARFLKDKFEELGLSADMYSPLEAGVENNEDYYAGRHLENRYNCAAVLQGSKHEKKLMLAAHEDTVITGDVNKWSIDPFKGAIIDGKIYGRGACDDKYALAASLFIMRLLKDNDIKLPYDTVIMGYSDEENGGGNGAIAAGLRYQCDDCISLDGHNLQIIAAGAGGGVIKCSLLYNGAADSCERMLDGLEIVRKEWRAFAEKRKIEFMENPYFCQTDIPDTTVRFTDIHSGMNGSAMNRIDSLITFYTIHNEEDTRAEWDEMIERINGELLPLNMTLQPFELITRFFHFVETEKDNKAMQLMSDLVGEMSDFDTNPVGMCLSDLPMFILHSTPRAFAFGCGRDFSQEGGPHQINEFICCDDLVRYVKILAGFLCRYGSVE